MMRMKHYFSLMVIVSYLMSVSAIARAQDVGWVGDVPVPAEALINTQTAVTFDSPSGRVVKFSFHSDFDETQIYSFYAQTLMNLGWNSYEDGFARDGEVMNITKTGISSEGRIIYQLSLRPRS